VPYSNKPREPPMNMRNEILIAALCAVCAGAMANVTTSTVGPTTTYSESFDSGSSFSAGWFNTPLNSDDYLLLDVLTPTSSFSFSSAVPLASLTLSFWYSVPGNNNGSVSVAGSGTIALVDTPGNVAQYLLNNPGPNNTTGFLNYNSYDAFYTTTLNNLVAGTYAVTFATPGLLTSLKVDDLTITAVAAPVPEPETYAMMLAGLAMIGWLNKLNRDSRRGSGR